MRIIDRIVRLFSREEEEESVLCSCVEHPFKSIVFFETAPLVDGSHTMFFVGICKTCGRYDGFPKENFLMAVQEGTEETINNLRDAGVDVEKVRLVLRYRLDDM